MGRFLLTWELGSGLGHLATMQPIAAGLQGRGHRVELALCDGSRAGEFFPGMTCRAAHVCHWNTREFIAEPSTFAEVLYNAGCGNLEQLTPLVDSWREIFAEVRPDVLVAEFSPLAFLAAQGLDMKTVQMATGHAWPPNITPLPDMCPWRNNYPERLVMTEAKVLETLNEQLERQRQPNLRQVAELFTRTDLQLLTTFAEMDHYQQRENGNYLGNWSHLPGEEPLWPVGNSPRVFAYLKSPVAIATVLGELERRGLATLAFVPDQAKLGLPSERGSIRITSRPVDIARAAADCDLAVLHTGHGTTLQMLLAGKPILALPLLGEQGLVAQNVVRLGAGLSAESDDPPMMLQALSTLLTDNRYARAAQAFREKYADFDRERQITHVLDLLEQQTA